MSDVLPEAVVKAKRWLAKTASDDQARNTEYEELAAAYDGFLFDLDQGDMSKRNTIISRTLKDSSTSYEQAVMFYEIPANLVRPLTEDWKSVMGVLPSVFVPPAKSGDQAVHGALVIKKTPVLLSMLAFALSACKKDAGSAPAQAAAPGAPPAASQAQGGPEHAGGAACGPRGQAGAGPAARRRGQGQRRGREEGRVRDGHQVDRGPRPQCRARGAARPGLPAGAGPAHRLPPASSGSRRRRRPPRSRSSSTGPRRGDVEARRALVVERAQALERPRARRPQRHDLTDHRIDPHPLAHQRHILAAHATCHGGHPRIVLAGQVVGERSTFGILKEALIPVLAAETTGILLIAFSRELGAFLGVH